MLDGLTARLSAVSPDAAQLMALKRVAWMVRQQVLTLTYNDVFMLMREAFFTPMPLTLLIAKASVASPAGGGH